MFSGVWLMLLDAYPNGAVPDQVGCVPNSCHVSVGNCVVAYSTVTFLAHL